jgi:hypothetical protein
MKASNRQDAAMHRDNMIPVGYRLHESKICKDKKSKRSTGK